MQFEPKSEAEIKAENEKRAAWPLGIYDFEITDAEDTRSKAGNDMIVLSLTVYHNEGHTKELKDYLLAENAGKLRNVSIACGLLESYDSGSLNSFDFIGKTGRTKLKVKKDPSGQYPDKNEVADYIPVAGQTTYKRPDIDLSNAEAPASKINDEIPF